MIPQFCQDNRPHNGITYSNFIEDAEKYVNGTITENWDENKKSSQENIKLNIHRMRWIKQR